MNRCPGGGRMGDSPLRTEDARLLAGRGRFVDDAHLPGMAEGAFVRSPLPHARILSIDASAALAAGALCVLTARDLPFNDRPWVVRRWNAAIRNGMPKFLAADRVRFVGDPVAFVVAPDRYLAEDLCALVRVEFDPLPPVASVAAATAPGAPLLHDEWTGNVAAEFSHRRGDVAAALARSAHRVRRRFRFPRQAPVPLEPRGVLADYDAGRGVLTVRMSTQAHYNVRQNLASLLDLPEERVRVIAEDVGGGFGSKSRTYPEEIIVGHACRVLRRPVKWIEDRLESLQATTHSRGVETDLEIACDAAGRLTALQAQVTLEAGGYVFTSGVSTAEVASAHLPNAYRVPDFHIDVRCVGTNKTPIGTYRGAGQPEAAFPIECLLDVLAKEVGIPATEIRRRNLVRSEDLPYEIGTTLAGMTPRFESGDFVGLLDLAVAQSGYSEEVQALAGGGRVAWGLACSIEVGGMVNLESARIRIDASGNVTVLSGMSSQGQGQRTTYAQVCAEALGVAFERVSVMLGDTDLVPLGRGAFASRGAIFGASAVLGAARELKARVLAAAAAKLGCAPGALDVVDGVIQRDGAPTALAIGDAAAGLEAHYVFDAGQPATYGVSVHAAKVELDARTGAFRLLDYLVAHDAGRVLNPMIVAGQIIGGAAEGVGVTALSEIVYDEGGHLLTGTLADYLVVTALEVPRIRLAHMETRPTTNPLGVRGIGEGGVIPAPPAIANALARAMDARRTGHEAALCTLPLRPERVLEACRAAGL